jgi:hypothetical protein
MQPNTAHFNTQIALTLTAIGASALLSSVGPVAATHEKHLHGRLFMVYGHAT